jgi:hypothetical protein
MDSGVSYLTATLAQCVILESIPSFTVPLFVHPDLCALTLPTPKLSFSNVLMLESEA